MCIQPGLCSRLGYQSGCSHVHAPALAVEGESEQQGKDAATRSPWVDFVDKGGQRPKFLITVIALA